MDWGDTAYAALRFYMVPGLLNIQTSPEAVHRSMMMHRTSRTRWEQSTSTRHAVPRCTTNSIWRSRLDIPSAIGSQNSYLLTS